MSLFLILALGSAEPVLDCTNVITQSDMNRCAYQDFQKADAELNVVWKDVSATMKAWDKEIDRDYDKAAGHFDTLLAAQRAWLTYRDEHCRLRSFEMRGGSMEPFIFQSCRARVTKERTRELQEYVEQRDG
jgi:uncharacterized protein YecT (DUF1311 family)